MENWHDKDRYRTIVYIKCKISMSEDLASPCMQNC